MISPATEPERTLFFDFLTIDLGEVKGFKPWVHLYAVPGQVYYNASRKLILKGVDGVIFVADSQVERMEASIEATHNLYENLESYGYDPTNISFAMQYNKRDLPNAMTMDKLRAQLNPTGVPDLTGIAIQGREVFETLGSVSKMVVQSLS